MCFLNLVQGPRVLSCPLETAPSKKTKTFRLGVRIQRPPSPWQAVGSGCWGRSHVQKHRVLSSCPRSMAPLVPDGFSWHVLSSASSRPGAGRCCAFQTQPGNPLPSGAFPWALCLETPQAERSLSPSPGADSGTLPLPPGTCCQGLSFRKPLPWERLGLLIATLVLQKSPKVVLQAQGCSRAGLAIQMAQCLPPPALAVGAG